MNVKSCSQRILRCWNSLELGCSLTAPCFRQLATTSGEESQFTIPGLLSVLTFQVTYYLAIYVQQKRIGKPFLACQWTVNPVNFCFHNIPYVLLYQVYSVIPSIQNINSHFIAPLNIAAPASAINHNGRVFLLFRGQSNWQVFLFQISGCFCTPAGVFVLGQICLVTYSIF